MTRSVALTVLLLVSVHSPVLADGAEPTVKEVYRAAESGHLEQAQHMIETVLRNHPTSAKAHYVLSEIYARERNLGLARGELARAEQLAPGLAFAKPEAVVRLKSEIQFVEPSPASAPAGIAGNETRIALVTQGGTFVVPVTINNAIKLDFFVDSGAASVSIPSDVFSTLVRTATIGKADLTGSHTYDTATGESFDSQTFIIRSLKIGGIEVANVEANVAPARGSLLLGQSFLQRFTTWSIDNTSQELVLKR
jgi:clan AA aspartic protease (TIGR02281 family)